jgi:uncharacterized protein (UPF0147 family)
MPDEEQLKDVIVMLSELKKDSAVPKNVKNKIEATIEVLEEKTELSIKTHRALHELEEVADDVNLQPFTRTQIWNIVSLLEKIA